MTTTCKCDELSPNTAKFRGILDIHNIGCPVFQAREAETWKRISREMALLEVRDADGRPVRFRR